MEEKLEGVIKDIMQECKVDKAEAKGVIVTLFDAYVHGIDLQIPVKELKNGIKH